MYFGNWLLFLLCKLLPNTCINIALEGFLGWIVPMLNVFPVSPSSVRTDESFVPTAKMFFSKPCKLQVLNCREMIPVEISLAICFRYNKDGPSMLITETCNKMVHYQISTNYALKSKGPKKKKLSDNIQATIWLVIITQIYDQHQR